MELIGHNVDYIAKLMSVSTKRHEVLAQNLANVNTPNYLAKRVDFEKAFRKALDRGVDDALDVEATVVDDDKARVKADGNSVHLEQEMGRLQKNQLMFEVYSSLLRQNLGHVKLAISSGR